MVGDFDYLILSNEKYTFETLLDMVRLAELFSWVTGRSIDKNQAMRCAKREPGRSWEAIESELAQIGESFPWHISLEISGTGSCL